MTFFYNFFKKSETQATAAATTAAAAAATIDRSTTKITHRPLSVKIGIHHSLSHSLSPPNPFAALDGRPTDDSPAGVIGLTRTGSKDKDDEMMSRYDRIAPRRRAVAFRARTHALVGRVVGWLAGTVGRLDIQHHHHHHHQEQDVVVVVVGRVIERRTTTTTTTTTLLLLVVIPTIT